MRYELLFTHPLWERGRGHEQGSDREFLRDFDRDLDGQFHRELDG
jgi:hypothetical protein